MRKIVVAAIAVATAVIAALAVSATVGLAKSSRSNVFETASVTNRFNETLRVWKANGSIHVARVGSPDAAGIRGRTVTLATHGRRFETETFSTRAAAWRAVTKRYGVSRLQTQRALSAPRRLSLPRALADAGAAPDGGPSTQTNVTDYGTNAKALAGAASFAVADLGASAAGHQLIDAYLMRFSNLAKNTDSGPVAAFVYSLSPKQFGLEGDDEIVVNVAPETSSWGQVYADSLTRTTPNDDGSVPQQLAPGLVELNSHQLVLRLGHSLINITATGDLSQEQWRSLAAAIKSP